MIWIKLKFFLFYYHIFTFIYFQFYYIFLIKFTQVISFIILFVCVLFIYSNITPSDIICNVSDMNNEIGTKINNNIKKEEIIFISVINRYKFSTFQCFYKQLNYSSTLCNNLLD